MIEFYRMALSGAAIAALAVAAVVSFNAAADAAPRTCSQRHSDCTSRCLIDGKDYAGGNACVKRTCDHQYNSCMADSSGGGERGGGGGRTGGGGGVGGPGKSTGKPVVRDHRK